MKTVLEEANRELRHWIKHNKLEDIMENYHWLVRLYFKSKKTLKSPYHSRTGKPLKEVTIYAREKAFERNEREYKARRLLIRLFLLEGIIGNPSDRLKNKLNEYFEKLQEEEDVNCLKELLEKLKRELPGYSKKERNAFLSLNTFDVKIIEEINKDFKRLLNRIEDLTKGRCKKTPELSFEEDPIGNLSYLAWQACYDRDYWRNEYNNVRHGGQVQKQRSKRKNGPALKVILGGRRSHGPFSKRSHDNA